MRKGLIRFYISCLWNLGMIGLALLFLFLHITGRF